MFQADKYLKILSTLHCFFSCRDMNKKLRDDKDEKELQRVRHRYKSEVTVFIQPLADF